MLSTMPRITRGDEHARDAAHAAQHHDGERAPDVHPPERRLDRTDDDEQRPGDRRGGDAQAEGPLLDAHRVRAHELQREAVLRDRLDRAAHEGARQVQVDARGERRGHRERHQHAQREIDEADAPGHADVVGLHQAVVDAVDQDQQHLDDEHDAEKERQPRQRLLAGALEGEEIDPVQQHADDEEQRRPEHADQHRVEAEAAVQDVGDVRADDDERRVRDVDDVELAEDDRQPERHGGVEAAEQDPRDDGVREKICGKHRRAAVLARCYCLYG